MNVNSLLVIIVFERVFTLGFLVFVTKIWMELAWDADPASRERVEDLGQVHRPGEHCVHAFTRNK